MRGPQQCVICQISRRGDRHMRSVRWTVCTSPSLAKMRKLHTKLLPQDTLFLGEKPYGRGFLELDAVLFASDTGGDPQRIRQA